jgi:hypothetical protein
VAQDEYRRRSGLGILFGGGASGTLNGERPPGPLWLTS